MSLFPPLKFVSRNTRHLYNTNGNILLNTWIPLQNSIKNATSMRFINSSNATRHMSMNFRSANNNVSSKHTEYFNFSRQYARTMFHEKVSMSTCNVLKYSDNKSPSSRFLWPLMLWCVTTLDQNISSSKTSSCENDDEEKKIQEVMEHLWNDVKKGNVQSISMNEVLKPLASSIGIDGNDILESGVPVKVTYGLVCGYTSGFALKKVGKIGSVAVGLGFVLIQTLSYNGYITVDFDRMNNDFNKLLDINDDEEVNEDDLNELMNRIYSVMSHNVPAGSGFGAGFLMGMRTG